MEFLQKFLVGYNIPPKFLICSTFWNRSMIPSRFPYDHVTPGDFLGFPQDVFCLFFSKIASRSSL